MAATLQTMVAAFNGDLFVPNDIGEADIGNPLNNVTVYTNAHVPGGGGGNANGPIAIIDQVRHFAVEIETQDLTAGIVTTARVKNVILAGRTAAWKLGLLLPGVAANTHNCSYNEALDVPDAPANAGTPVWIDFAWQMEVSRQATNFVCHLAYIFRWRGHHFKPDYTDAIAQKWSKNLNARNDLIGRDEWAHLFTRGLHAIFPDVLDNFWVTSVAASHCCNPLALRLNVPCAGTATFFAMLAGIKEAKLIYPTAIERCKAEADELLVVCTDLLTNRWKGGVNRAFYGAVANTVAEGKFSALAAVIFGMNTPEDHVTELGKSDSLSRVAKNAPLSSLVMRSTTSGILKMCLSGETQANLGNSALKRIVFTDDKA